MTEPATLSPLGLLASPAVTLGQTIRALETLDDVELRPASLGLSSNVTIDLLGTFLRKHAALHGVRLSIAQGNFDDPLGDMDRFQATGVDQMLLLPFFDNLQPAFEAQAAHLSPEDLGAREEDFRQRYRLVFQRASGMKAVYLGTMHRMGRRPGLAGDQVDEVVARFNRILEEETAPFPNIHLLDTAETIDRVGLNHAFDLRFYFSAKAPYATAFFDDLARRVVACSRGFGGQFYKVLVLDCDNTLWGGVIGEDLLEGIKLGPFEHPGNIFWRVQHEVAALERAGVLLCLCSKNNPADVMEVLERHPQAVLRKDQFVLNKVNWDDKPANLRAMAQELNLGLDSMVFLDDSPFECEAVRTQLPMVRTFQVPARLADYPALFGEIKELFLAGGVSDESRSKTEQYRLRALGEELKAVAGSREDYLSSLGLTATLGWDVLKQVPRISELSNKSNQFNLTTRRYSEADILALMESPNATVLSIQVSDRFGDAGLTGVLILHWEGETARVDSFFMSCRVIGRGIESSIWQPVLALARVRGCRSLEASFLPTAKNAQVSSYFDNLGLPLVKEGTDGARHYRIPIDLFVPPETPWIEVTNAE